MFTAKSTWNKLSLAPFRKGLEAVSAAAANRVTAVATEFGRQGATAAAVPTPNPDLNTSSSEPQEDWELDKEGPFPGWGSNEGSMIGAEFGWRMAKPYTPNTNQAQLEQKTSNFQGNQITKARIFQQDELQYDPLGVSGSWHQEAKEPDTKKRREVIAAQWKAKSERTVRQQADKIERDPVETITRRHIQDERVKANAEQQTLRISRNLGASSTKEKGMPITAGMDREAEVTISLPSLAKASMRRLKSDDPSEGPVLGFHTL